MDMVTEIISPEDAKRYLAEMQPRENAPTEDHDGIEFEACSVAETEEFLRNNSLTITPEVEHWLSVMKRREADHSDDGGLVSIPDMARFMREGSWALNGQPLLFDTENRLIDGVRRLKACVLANVPFETCVVRGYDDADPEE